MPGVYRTRRSISWRRGWLLIEACAALGAACAAVRLLPFRRIVEDGMPTRTSRADTADLQSLRWAVQAMARRVPWRALCFERALALRTLLRRRGIASVLHYGIAPEASDSLVAHVWLSVDGEVVIGGENSARFARVASFPQGPLANPSEPS